MQMMSLVLYIGPLAKILHNWFLELCNAVIFILKFSINLPLMYNATYYYKFCVVLGRFKHLHGTSLYHLVLESFE